jgi:SAM-dependent methyltransferase
MMSDTNLRSTGQLSTRESESRIKATRVKLVPLKPGWHNEVSISSPITDINGIPRLGWHTEVSIPTHMADVMRIPAYTFLVLLGKRVVHPGGRPSTEEMYRLAQFQSGQRVLEVGCGAGTTAIEIASRFNCQVTAIDIDSVMLDRARINVHNAGLDGKVIVQRADVMDLPFLDQMFDCVVIENVMILVNRARALQEILRVCRNGGRIVDHEFVWEQEPPLEVRRIFEQTISPYSHFGDWSEFYRTAGLSNVEAVSGASNWLSPVGLLRDEGLKNILVMTGRLLSQRSYQQRMMELIQQMSQISAYLRWTVVGGMKSKSAMLAPESMHLSSSTGSYQSGDLVENWLKPGL